MTGDATPDGMRVVRSVLFLARDPRSLLLFEDGLLLTLGTGPQKAFDPQLEW
jgi:hypothetical protein